MKAILAHSPCPPSFPPICSPPPISTSTRSLPHILPALLFIHSPSLTPPRLAQVRDCFKALQGTMNVLGLTNTEVLLQEYLSGDEYVVDTVSRNGVHKCVAIWKYDKRKYNNAPFVYFGMRFLPVDAEPQLQAMVEYIFRVLDSLGIKHGCMHSEVKLETRGPVLIEVNCRMHGGEGTWAPMAEACVGYSAVSACADCFIDPAAFAFLPVSPSNFMSHAMEAKLRSGVEGILTAVDESKIAQIRALPSYSSEMMTFSIGKEINKTVDAVTACGNINLINPDLEQLQRDYAKIHELQEEGLFTASPMPLVKEASQEPIAPISSPEVD